MSLSKIDSGNTESRQGVQNYIRFMQLSGSSSRPFPIQREDLQKYIQILVKKGVKPETLKRYVGHIKSHNIVTEGIWNYGEFNPLIKRGLDQLNANGGQSAEDISRNGTNEQLHASDLRNVPPDMSNQIHPQTYAGTILPQPGQELDSLMNWGFRSDQNLCEGGLNGQLPVSNFNTQNSSGNTSPHPEQELVDLMNIENWDSQHDQNLREGDTSMNNSYTILSGMPCNACSQTCSGDASLRPEELTSLMTITETLNEHNACDDVSRSEKLNRLYDLFEKTVEMYAELRLELLDIMNSYGSGDRTLAILEYDSHLRKVEKQISCLRLEARKLQNSM
ncbi:11308_t:CDS:2 [Acaulospora morrowiae]|uniref:11308_t:CDS:1 n=1 Tax=Acaulospora morrowiae TaxID=94023 RepID=A0A9N9AKZ8_9GLOM|nr:11308_t:CDS:2 [Acaulospora morrowiae]